MGAAKRSACVFCTFKQGTVQVQSVAGRRRGLHSSAARCLPRIKQTREPIKPLKKSDMETHYDDVQQAAIKATQEELGSSIKDMHEKTNDNWMPWAMRYRQDMTQLDPSYDKRDRAVSNAIKNKHFRSMDNLASEDEDVLQDPNWWKRLSQVYGKHTDPKKDESERIALALAKMTKPDGMSWEEFRNIPTHLAPSLPNFRDEAEKAEALQKASSKDGKDKRIPGMDTKATGEDMSNVSPAMLRLMQMTGLDLSQLRQLKVKSIISHRVVNQTRLGKIGKQYWLSVAGNGNGMLGIGEGKSEESAEGMIQSQYRAIRNMVPIMRYEQRTIFGTVNGKEGATELEISARPPGFGLRCQQYIYEMARCAGISDLSARVTRARNPMNTVKAAFKALTSQKDPEEIAKGRGKKLVDVRKVYYAGNV